MHTRRASDTHNTHTHYVPSGSLSERMKDELMRLDFDIHHISVMSRRSKLHHGMVRLVISTLATPEEIENLVKKDVRKNRTGRMYSVKLTSAGKSRMAFIDDRTHRILMELCEGKRGREKIFPFSKEEMDSIVGMYSPPGRSYGVERLRKAVISILRDCSIFGEDFVSNIVEGREADRVADFLEDFHPFFSGMWDLEDEEVAKDFLKVYSEVTGKGVREIAERVMESEERVRKLLDS